MQRLMNEYFAGTLSRRGFFERLVATGFSAAGARAVIAASQEAPVGASSRRVVRGTGGDLLVAQIEAAGTRYVFTNPGSYEVGFFDALTDHPEIQVIVGLHEGIVIPLADGYHKVTGQPALVNVHAIGGTAQMAGQLSNAFRDGSSIVVTAGMKDISGFHDDAMLMPTPGFSQIEITRQFQKMAWEARDPASFPLMTRRGYRVSMAAPGGPVYVCYASDGLERPDVSSEVFTPDAFMVEARPRPSRTQVEELARLLVEAERPALVVGDEVWKGKAQADVVRLAELLGLAVAGGSGNSITSFKSFPTAHRQYAPSFRTAYPEVGPDLVVQYGTRDLGDYSIGSGRNAVPGEPLLGTARVAAVGIDPDTMGRTLPLDLAVVGHVAEATRDLIDAVHALATPGRLERIRARRLAAISPVIDEARTRRRNAAEAALAGPGIHPERVAFTIDRVADRDAIIVGENWSGREASGTFIEYGFREDERMWLENGGRALGWGIGAAAGVKLGAPDRQVILTIGDGAVMYSAAGLWTLARYRIPVLIVVSNNQYYQTVRGAFVRYDGRMAATGKYHALYLGDPDLDFVKLAESQGVMAERVTAGSDLEAAVRRGVRSTRDGRPYLLDVHVSRTGAGAESTWHQDFDLARTRTKQV